MQLDYLMRRLLHNRHAHCMAGEKSCQRSGRHVACFLPLPMPLEPRGGLRRISSDPLDHSSNTVR